MRKANWVAAAAGVVLLVAGCGGEGGSGKRGGSSGGSSAGSSSGSTGGGGSEAGGSLDADAVTKEITDAATAAGFTQDSSGEDVPAKLKDCMVSWTADAKKAADPKKSYDATVKTLSGGGWKEGQKFEQNGSTIKTLDKENWTLKASNHGATGFAMVMFIASDNSAECAALFKADLEQNKKS
ncbi:hypothetical protein GPZ77_10275 [Streptomyces sp. QHH-9511]|uniref:hypothetical protein n=1 Tax=Streptomyces sp. QHH-9511 TaxID=2684468 RepID=UPI001318A22F|nr:hypothetical protein [Streptomyces sp. QHH-9511]QGZ48712.1 hypothetical protein GPZ77_10275 [Streptomyces sp. QHH-9511]